VDALTALDLEVLVVDLTSSDVASAGFHVVRVVIPGTVDMNTDERFARLGGGRLYNLPVKLGLAERPRAEADLNRHPVPLA
jgi:ribosomal protein S12 methylthiotransferase accessory factor